MDCIAGGLQYFFFHYLYAGEYGRGAYQIKIGICVFGYLGFRLEYAYEDRGEQAEKQQKKYSAGNREEQCVCGGFIRTLLILGAQPASDEGICAGGSTYRHCGYQHLERKYQRYGGERVFADAGYEYAVYNVVCGQHQHGYHYRQGHFEYKPRHGKISHFVLSLGVFHGFISS